MDYLFDGVGLNRIAACHDANNPKSGRVMEKAGMKREGILRAAGKNNLGICDEVWYAMIRNDRKKWRIDFLLQKSNEQISLCRGNEVDPSALT